MERIAAAEELLSQGEADIDDIAAAVGFGSAHTLRRPSVRRSASARLSIAGGFSQKLSSNRYKTVKQL